MDAKIQSIIDDVDDLRSSREVREVIKAIIPHNVFNTSAMSRFAHCIGDNVEFKWERGGVVNTRSGRITKFEDETTVIVFFDDTQQEERLSTTLFLQYHVL